MNTLIKLTKKEHGQIIPILVVSLIALIAMAALLLDGGALLLNRRSAQNAADAAALAGARIYCGSANATSAEVEAIVIEYTQANNATLLNWYITDENVGDSYDDIQYLTKGEVVVSVAVEHGSFFARIFNQDTLRATATAGAGCFPYGPDVILPIAFPCQVPVRESEAGVSIASDNCDYVMLEWEYFDWVAIDICEMSANPLLEGVTPTSKQAECISDYLVTNHPEYIYVVVNNSKMCTKDSTNVDPGNELLCDLFGDGSTNLTNSSRGWLNLSTGNAGTATIQSWINGNTPVGLHEHVWLSFIGGERANPVFDTLSNRLFEIVYIPTFNYVCSWKPQENDKCWNEAHHGWYLVDENGNFLVDEEGEKIFQKGVEDSQGVCKVIDGSPGTEFAHVVAFAPFFTTCIREGSKDLEKHNPTGNPSIYDYNPEGFVADCPGFGLAATAEAKDSDGKSYYPNMKSLEKTGYSFEGFFISPKFLENTENMSAGGTDLGIYVAFLTR
jgi:hypothetical protein